MEYFLQVAISWAMVFVVSWIAYESCKDNL